MSNIYKLYEILSNFKTKTSKDETYSLRIVTDWLTSHNISYEYRSAGVDAIRIYEHGVSVKLPGNNNKLLSIQTHSSVAGWAFAETLLTDNMLSEIRHKTPEALFEYIRELLNTKVIHEEKNEDDTN